MFQGKLVTARKRRQKRKRRYAAIKQQPNEGKVNRAEGFIGCAQEADLH